MKNKMSTTWAGTAVRASIHQSFQTSHTITAAKPRYAESTSSMVTGGETVGSLMVAIRKGAANDRRAIATTRPDDWLKILSNMARPAPSGENLSTRGRDRQTPPPTSRAACYRKLYN